MKAVTQEWVEKAERLWGGLQAQLLLRKVPNVTLAIEHRGRVAPHYGAAVMMARDCARDYLFARLEEEALPLVERRDLTIILDQLLPLEPTWRKLSPNLYELMLIVNGYRQPDEPIDKDDVLKAQKLCAEVRLAVRLSLNLPL